MDELKAGRWRARAANTLFVVLFLSAIGLIAWLSHTYNYQADWTSGNRNSLSDSSRELLMRLEGPVRMTAFAAYDATLYQSIRDRIARYQRFKKDLMLDFVNPELAPDRAQQAGITRSGQLLVEYRGRMEILDELSEQSLTNALARLTRARARTALFLDGHEERDIFQGSDEGLSQLRDFLTRSGFSVDRLNFVRTPTIPEETDLLVIAAPKKKLTTGEVAKILEWIEAGGNLLWLDDPGQSNGLEALATHLGLNYVPGVLVDANQELRLLLGIQHPAIVPIVDYGQHPITRNLSLQTLFPYAVAIEYDQADSAPGWRFDPLLTTLDRVWAEVDEIGDDTLRYEEAKGDRLGPMRIGVAITREREGEKQQRIVVIGDSDFMSNGVLGQGANLDLAMNTFNWLARDDNLIAISPKTAPDTQLNFSETGAAIFGIGFLFVLPIGLIVAGFFIWFRRRRA